LYSEDFGILRYSAASSIVFNREFISFDD